MQYAVRGARADILPTAGLVLRLSYVSFPDCNVSMGTRLPAMGTRFGLGTYMYSTCTSLVPSQTTLREGQSGKF